MKGEPLIAIPVSKVLLDEAAQDPAAQAWLAKRAVELAEREKRVSVVRSATARHRDCSRYVVFRAVVSRCPT